MKHGTRWGYNRHRCRCVECRAANTAAQERRRRRRGVRPNAVYRAAVTGRTHGLRTTYVKGCRCDACRNAERTYRRALRARQRAA